MDWRSARWIWFDGDEKKECRHVIFQRDFRLDELPVRAELHLSADTSYRLRINGQWSSDGPARMFAGSYFYDTLDCSHLLRCGLNRLESDVLFSGEDSARCGGFIALLEMAFADGTVEIVATDPTWRAAVIPQFVSGEGEIFDNSILKTPVFSPAAVVCDANAGIWQTLVPRPTPMLTRREALIRRVTNVNLTSKEDVLPEERETFSAPAGLVENIQYLVYPDDRCAVIHPAEGFDLELCCDSGHGNTGFWNFVLYAPAGTVVDIAVAGNPENSRLRYICREGWNRYTASLRRCGRELTVTLRYMTGPVRFQSLRLVESTYPVIPCGEFDSSDRTLDRIYKASARNLKLSMEDIFTGGTHFSPGVCRNETLFALSCYGAEDLAKHSLCFSFDRILAGKKPLEAFDFLPVFSLAEIYNELGDAGFLQELYPQASALLETAKKQIDQESGLLKNSSGAGDLEATLLYKAALDTASALAGPAGVPPESTVWMQATCENIALAANALWDDRHLSFCSGLDPQGQKIPVYPVQSSVLALLAGVVPENRRSSLCANIISPRSSLKEVSTAVGDFLWLEALEKLEMYELVIDKIRTGEAVGGSGETASALYILPRIVLGLKNGGGCRTFVVSPFVCGLEYASGTRWTPHGPVSIAWRKTGGRELVIDGCVPPGVTLQYQENISLRDFNVKFNCIESGKV